MLSTVARVDGREIISSGVLYVEPGEQIVFYPFKGDRNESFRLDVIVVDEMPIEQIDYALEGSQLVIKFHRTWNSGLETSASNIEIGSDSQSEFVMLRFSCLYIGDRQFNLMKLSYSILRTDGHGSSDKA